MDWGLQIDSNVRIMLARASSYQWFKNGAAVSGATSNSYTFYSQTDDTHTVYLNVTDSLGTTVKLNVASVTTV